MNYTGFVLALQLCMILGSSSNAQSPKVTDAIEKLKGYFNANNSDVADSGGSLFLDILKKWKEESDKKMIQSQVISFYFKLFENFTQNQMVQRSMDVVKEEIVKEVFNRSQEKLDDFQKLIGIQVNDMKVQKKAIHELFNVMGYLPTNTTQRKRKRSQNQLRGRRAPKY